MAGRYMTDGEIITSYRQAKSPARQINTIAQLNAIPRSKVEDILIAAGYPIKRKPMRGITENPKQTRKGHTCRRWTEREDRILIRMSREERPVAEICERLARPRSSVNERRRLWKEKGKI